MMIKIFEESKPANELLKFNQNYIRKVTKRPEQIRNYKWFGNMGAICFSTMNVLLALKNRSFVILIMDDSTDNSATEQERYWENESRERFRKKNRSERKCGRQGLRMRKWCEWGE